MMELRAPGGSQFYNRAWGVCPPILVIPNHTWPAQRWPSGFPMKDQPCKLLFSETP